MTFAELITEAESIRDANTQYANTKARISTWMLACVSYINKENPEACNAIANQINAATDNYQNTASLVGDWCTLALAYYGDNLFRLDVKAKLQKDANTIATETNDAANVTRLGDWFVWFMLYVDPTPDTIIYIYGTMDDQAILTNATDGETYDTLIKGQ